MSRKDESPIVVMKCPGGVVGPEAEAESSIGRDRCHLGPSNLDANGRSLTFEQLCNGQPTDHGIARTDLPHGGPAYVEVVIGGDLERLSKSEDALDLGELVSAAKQSDLPPRHFSKFEVVGRSWFLRKIDEACGTWHSYLSLS